MSQELDTTQGGAVTPSQGEAVAVATKEQERQPVDLTKLDEFKKWQSAADSRDAYNRQMAYEAQQRAANLEQQFHQMRMQGMDKEQQLEYQNQLLQNQLAEVGRQRELDQLAFTRQRDMEEIATKTGVSFEELRQFNNAHDAWRYAVDKAQPTKGAKAAPKAEALDAEVPDNVDLGSGKPVEAGSKYHNEWKRAKNETFDMRGMWEAEEKALKAGVDISKWS